MPKPTVSNPSRNPRGSSRGGSGIAATGWATEPAPEALAPCSVCDHRVRTVSVTRTGDNRLVCRACCKRAGIPFEADHADQKRPEGVDGRALQRFVKASREFGYLEGLSLRDRNKIGSERARRCAWPECRSRTPMTMPLCRVHWRDVPEHLRSEFRASNKKPERREVWKRIERYAVIRHRLTQKAQEVATS